MNHRIRCLVVDDTPSTISLLSDYLEKYTSIEVQATTDDKQAFRWIGESPIDLLFTDLEMPYYSGLDMLSALEGKRHGKAFLVTGSQITSDQINSSALLDVLYKPLSEKRFDQAMKTYFAHHQKS